jgi:hypothetical protein
MASTRSKNTPGNYCNEQWSLGKQESYLVYKDASISQKTMFASDGLLPARIGASELSYNYADIESYLFGVGSTNLVKPLPDVVPHVKDLNSLSVIDRLPVYVPEPLQVACNQRQYPLR